MIASNPDLDETAVMAEEVNIDSFFGSLWLVESPKPRRP